MPCRINYVYMYTYMYTYVCIYIYIYVHTARGEILHAAFRGLRIPSLTYAPQTNSSLTFSIRWCVGGAGLL